MKNELYIATIITNNEERTVERAAHRRVPHLSLRQFRFVGTNNEKGIDLLRSLSFFNPQKEMAFIKQEGRWHKWNADTKTLIPLSSPILTGITFLRTDEPDTLAIALGNGAKTGVVYDCRGVTEDDVHDPLLLQVFCNPHSSSIERIPA